MIFGNLLKCQSTLNLYLVSATPLKEILSEKRIPLTKKLQQEITQERFPLERFS